MTEEEIQEFWASFRMYHFVQGQRKGQAMMNALWDAAPELYADISGTSKDCFHRDDQVFAFRDYLGI